MKTKHQIATEFADFRFRHMLAANSECDAHLWCYVKPATNEIEYAVQQGHDEEWFDTLDKAIEWYNAL